MMQAWTLAAILLLAGAPALAQQPSATPAPATRAASRATTRPYTAHTYDDAIRELHDRGFPATMADLQSPAVPDDQNAAVWLTRAATMFIPEDCSPRSSSIDYSPGLPYPPQWFELAERSLLSHAELLKAVRKARACLAISWDPSMPPDAAAWLKAAGPDFAGLRSVSNTVADAALLEHFRGDDAEALQYARDLFFIADANGRRPFLVSHLVSSGIRSMAAETLLLIGTELHLADARRSTGAGTGHEATRQQCKELIARLLDDAPLREERRRIIFEERVYTLSDMHARSMLASDHWRQLLPQMLEVYDCVAAGIPTDHLNEVTGEARKVVATAYARDAQQQAHLGMLRTAAAVAIAARMYLEDHGAYPPDLQALVPDYLPHLPADPYSPSGAGEGAPVLYRGGNRPMVGSAGPDGVDAHLPPPVQAKYSVQHPKPGEPDDQWIDLTARR